VHILSLKASFNDCASGIDVKAAVNRICLNVAAGEHENTVEGARYLTGFCCVEALFRAAEKGDTANTASVVATNVDAAQNPGVDIEVLAASVSENKPGVFLRTVNANRTHMENVGAASELGR
jgi:hypothetical protein